MYKLASALIYLLIATVLITCSRNQEISREKANQELQKREITVSDEALLTYVLKQDVQVVEFLLIAGSDANTMILNAPPLIWASSLGNDKLVRLLVKHGARLNARDSGVSALMIAAMEGHEKVVFELLEMNANVDLQNANGMTALMSAAYNGHHEIVKMLLRKGADTELRMEGGLKAADIAEGEGHFETALLIRESKNAIF